MTIPPKDDDAGTTAGPGSGDEGSVADPTSGPPADETAGGLRPWRAGAAIAAILVLVAVAAIAVATRPDDDATPPMGMTMMGGTGMPMAGMRAGCEQWVASRGAGGTPGSMPRGGPGSTLGYRGAMMPDAAWCASMTSWMSDQVARGAGGPLRGQTPEDGATACRQWMGTGMPGGSIPGVNGMPSMPGGAAPDPAWCDQMVTWMRDHPGGWNGWMNGGGAPGGPMPGGSMPGGQMPGGMPRS